MAFAFHAAVMRLKLDALRRCAAEDGGADALGVDTWASISRFTATRIPHVQEGAGCGDEAMRRALFSWTDMKRGSYCIRWVRHHSARGDLRSQQSEVHRLEETKIAFEEAMNRLTSLQKSRSASVACLRADLLI